MILINVLNPGMNLSLLVFTKTTKKPKGSVGSGHVVGCWTNTSPALGVRTEGLCSSSQNVLISPVVLLRTAETESQGSDESVDDGI